MKSTCLTGVAVTFCCLLLTSAGAQVIPLNQSQPQKPALFARLPQKIFTSIRFTDDLFTSVILQTVKFPFGDDNFFEGVVIEKVQQSAQVTSINIRSSNYDGALFTLSKITRDDHTVTYTGRIINARYGDVYVVSMESNQLVFTKQNQSVFMVE